MKGKVPMEHRGIRIRRLMAIIAGVGCLLGALVWAMRSGVWWGLSQAFELAAHFFPRFAWAAGGGAIVALIAAVIDRRVWRIRSLWLLLPLIVPIAILAFGRAFAYDGAPQDIIEQRTQVLGWLFWLHVPLGIALLACFRSATQWIIIAGLSTATAWLSFGALFLSSMSVTGNWL